MAEEVKKAEAEKGEAVAPGKKGVLFGLFALGLAVGGAYVTTVVVPPLDPPRGGVRQKLQEGWVQLAETLNGNLVGDRFRHMYSLNVSFEYRAADKNRIVSAFEDERQLSRLTSRLNAVVARQSREDLYTAEFRQALIDAANEVLFAQEDGEFTEVLLTNIVIQ